MNKEGIMEDNRKGTWEDVTGECEVSWYSFSMGGYAEVRHNGNAIAFIGPKVRICETPDYRVLNTDTVGDSYTGYMKVERFIPDPKPEWIDITAECNLTFKGHESGHYIRIGYDGDLEDEALGYVGETVEMNSPSRYRITTHPRKIDRGGLDSGCIKVEKRNG